MTVDYDRPVDVLVVTLGERVPMEGEGHPSGIELDYAIDDGAPCAVKVIGFKANGWSVRIGQLAKQIADHLSGNSREIADAIEEAIS